MGAEASIHYVPYARASEVPNVIVDGAATTNTVLTLSHWPHSGTPPELRADTSAEIVFKYLDTPKFHVGARAASNNHFDEDGLLGLFAIINPELALRHRALLVDASKAGDFGVYRDRKAARVAFTLAAYANRDTSPLPAAVFEGPYPEVTGALYAQLLEILPRVLANPDGFRSLWGTEDIALTVSEQLFDQGMVTIEELNDLDLAIVRLPQGLARVSGLDECHPFALHSKTSCTRILIVQGGHVELQYRYEGWVQMASRRPALRVDLAPLADELNQREGSARWIFDGVDQIMPALHLKGDATTTLPSDLIVERVEHHLRTGIPSWNPYD